MSETLVRQTATRLWLRRRDELAAEFGQPLGEPALCAADSLTWRVFANPVAVFVGGVAAVILELAEPRVRSGVWDHTTFRSDPLARMERTGLAAMVTVYAARSVSEPMIARVRRLHERVHGTTPGGVAYHANEPELLDWVQATASFGFLEAYRAFVRPLGDEDCDSFYAEGTVAARLYGAVGAPTSLAALEACFAAMRPRLERSEIVFEFLEILHRTPILPRPLRPIQSMLIRAGVEITPAWARELLGLGARHGLRPFEDGLLRGLARLSGRIVIRSSPPALACQRLGLPARHLLRKA